MKKVIFLSLMFLVPHLNSTPNVSVSKSMTVNSKSLKKTETTELSNENKTIQKMNFVLESYLKHEAPGLAADEKKKIIEDLLKNTTLKGLFDQQNSIESLMKEMGMQDMGSAHQLLTFEHSIPEKVYTSLYGFLSLFAASNVVSGINNTLIKNKWYFGYVDKTAKIIMVLSAVLAAVTCKFSSKASEQIQLMKPFVNKYNENINQIMNILNHEISMKLLINKNNK